MSPCRGCRVEGFGDILAFGSGGQKADSSRICRVLRSLLRTMNLRVGFRV